MFLTCCLSSSSYAYLIIKSNLRNTWLDNNLASGYRVSNWFVKKLLFYRDVMNKRVCKCYYCCKICISLMHYMLFCHLLDINNGQAIFYSDLITKCGYKSFLHVHIWWTWSNSIRVVYKFKRGTTLPPQRGLLP